MTEKIDFTTAPCEWTERDAEYVALCDIFKQLRVKDVKTLSIKD